MMAASHPEISCIILAGGTNSRIGINKALLKLGEQTIIESQVSILSRIFPEIIIVSNALDEFRDLNANVIQDRIPGLGPLGGLYSGLQASSNEYSFLIGCDMPFINVELIHFMIGKIDKYDIVVPLSSEGMEALHSFYSQKCLDVVKQQIETNDFKIIEIFKRIDARYLSTDEIKKIDPKEHCFFNINNRNDYKKAFDIHLKLQ